MQFTKEELQNIAVLIKRATLKGEEAVGTASLLIKIGNLMNPKVTSIPEGTEKEPISEVEVSK